MRVATWNLERPSGHPGARPARQRAWMDRIDADIWVLSEAHTHLSPGTHTEGLWSQEAAGQVWAAIWTRHPMRPLGPPTDPQRAVCAMIEPAGRVPVVLYASVLPWLGSPWRDLPAAGGRAFAGALAAHLVDWQALRAAHADCDFILAGDLNQDLAPRHHYGSRANRAALKAALKAAGLACLSAGEQDPVWQATEGRHATVNHICANPRLANQAVGPARSWPPGHQPDRGLSDHFGVVVDFG